MSQSGQQEPGLGGAAQAPAASQPVVHIRGDSQSELEALFSVLNKNPQEPSRCFKNKKLPTSFFIQPNHSREGSQDSSTAADTGGYPAPRQVAGLAIDHRRSHSAPAQPLGLSAPPSAPAPVHGKQLSVDLLAEEAHQPAWGTEQGKQPGQRYFLNHNGQQQWQQTLLDPRKSNSNHSLNSGAGPQQATPTLSPSQSLQHSPAVSVQDLGALPSGWEQGLTPEGEVYFINHVDKSTSWFDPRIPKHLQKPGPMRLNQVQQQIGQPQGSPQQPSLNPGLSQQAPPPSQLSPGQQQQPAIQQRQRPTPNDKYIALELQKLQREKERLQREQEEIAAKENMLQELMSAHMISSPETKPPTLGQQTVAPSLHIQQAITTSSVDPFLGQAGNSLESHARQNSADSGLGGMGTGYSLPRTPEDFLSNVDEMETQDGGHNKILKQHTISSDFNMNELQGTMGMELGSLGDPSDNPTGGMDSEELVPSLQEDIGNELLNMNEMDVPKMENLLYM